MSLIVKISAKVWGFLITQPLLMKTIV